MLGGRKHNNKIKFADVVDVMAKQAGITQKDSKFSKMFVRWYRQTSNIRRT